MDADTDISIPRVLVVPNIGNVRTNTKAHIGQLNMSGGKLYVCTAEGVFELITSAAIT